MLQLKFHFSLFLCNKNSYNQNETVSLSCKYFSYNDSRQNLRSIKQYKIVKDDRVYLTAHLRCSSFCYSCRIPKNRSTRWTPTTTSSINVLFRFCNTSWFCNFSTSTIFYYRKENVDIGCTSYMKQKSSCKDNNYYEICRQKNTIPFSCVVLSVTVSCQDTIDVLL